MIRISEPVVILPPVYELSFNLPGLSRWCKLTEVCAVACDLTRITETDFKPTPEELISRFAGLVRSNNPHKNIPGITHSKNIPEGSGEQKNKKIFRYSLDGTGFWGTEVPTDGFNAPPYAPFHLAIEIPYPESLFVPEEWAASTLNAVRRGAIAAADFGEMQIGFPPRASKQDIIHLGGKREMILLTLPQCA